MPGASGIFSINLGTAHIAEYPSGQLCSNIGANICLLSGVSYCFCCPASLLLRCSSPFCGSFCCEEVGASVDEQKAPSPRRLILPFEQPWVSGLATAACTVPTLLVLDLCSTHQRHHLCLSREQAARSVEIRNRGHERLSDIFSCEIQNIRLRKRKNNDSC